MLIAERDGLRIEAGLAERGGAFVCPECGRDLILRRGELKVAHFAHRPPVECREASGETAEHHHAKAALRDGFAARGLRVDVEWRLVGDPAERRSDVVVWSPTGRPVAVEVQRSGQTLGEIRRRSESYMRAGIGVAWVGVVDDRLAAAIAAKDPAAAAGESGLFLDRHPVPAWTRFAAFLAYGRGYFFDPAGAAVWFARLEAARDFAAPFVVEDAAGSRRVGGTWRSMKTRADLRLWGPVPVGDLRIVPHRRRAATLGRLALPGGPIAWFDSGDGLNARIDGFVRRLRRARAAVLAPRPDAARPAS